MSYIDFKSNSKLTSQHTDNFRLDLKLQQPCTTFFNSFSYKTLAKTALGDRYLSDGDSDNTNDWLMDYEEDTCIDNTELYPDSFPFDQQTELGGFFINCGKLKLMSINQPAESDKPKKQVPKKRNRKKLDQGICIESSEGNDVTQPVCKKKATKNDANAKLDTIIMVMLKGRMKTQDPSVRRSKQNSDMDGDVSSSSKNGEGLPEFKHSFVSPKHRMRLSMAKVPRKM